jgi:hypothetical protein
VLTRHNAGIAHHCWRRLPFLSEIKSLLDWSATKTTLTMMEWLRVDDIAHQLFVNKRQLVLLERSNRRRGGKQPFKYKVEGFAIVVGGVLLFFAPLIVANVQQALETKSNHPYAVQVSANIVNTDTGMSTNVCVNRDVHWVHPSGGIFPLLARLR